ncbi:granzyme A-like [Pseudophryne corroboree]|uniref:granzyme A-like n=1 Tax=Pseudophryne corroboree TaxID=495146 RepID=UPI0030817F94
MSNMSLLRILVLVAIVLPIQKCDAAEITGGKEVVPHSRPYMALVRTAGKAFCGGTLIRPIWVLTSADCIVDKTTTVDLGVHSIKNTKDSQRQRFTVIQAIPHPKFNKEKHMNNLQLLKLSGKADLTKTVKTVTFPERFTDAKPGSVCDIIGWGRTDNKKPGTSDKLMEARVTVLDRKVCAAQWKPTVRITKDMMCTSGKEAARGFCNGDVGGPLICGGFQKAIISFGSILCGTPNGADVYTRLTKEYVKWIKKQIK